MCDTTTTEAQRTQRFTEKTRTMKQIAIIGAGSWGTALAVVAARAGHEVRLWSRNAAVVTSINEQRVNSRYLSSTSIPASVIATADHGSARCFAGSACSPVSRCARNVYYDGDSVG